MSLAIPLILQGNNLGERHRHFNSIVQDAHRQGAPLETVLALPETSSIDYLFKIELASKHRNVDFILKTLQHEDMLFVSRALKCCTWLLESKYRNVINPEHLETELYPHMITPAVNKMKHWLQINLRYPQGCQQFYQYYSHDYDTKVKFLWRCSPEFIKNEFLNIIDRVTPKQLKIICEYCPKALKLYYDNFNKNTETLKVYFENERDYFECSKYILRAEPDSYFDILEKYYDYERFGSLSPTITEYIMKQHKQRFVEKPVLFAAWILNKNTLAKYLSEEENKEIILKLARAQYLGHRFSYKFVEPFIKRLKANERAAFKKKVFVDKDVGDKVTDCPYPKFSRPELEDVDTVFDDIEHQPEDYRFFNVTNFKRCIRKRKGGSFEKQCIMYSDYCKTQPVRTALDELFDRYRFFNYDRTMFELRKKLAAESSVKNREFMILVLISKCGENMDQMEKLIRFLIERHNNEPSNLRATIVRSMVVRACVWRLPSDAWSLLLDFGRDLGLDGASPLICREGMHAAVLRALLSGEECPVTLREVFLKNFSSLFEYKLGGIEKRIVKERLPALLLEAATADPSSSLDRFELLFDTLTSINKKVSECPSAVNAFIEAVRRHPSSAESLLQRMYDERVARRELFRENFTLFQTNESYLNALRHDATLLKSTNDFENRLKEQSFNYDGFLRKLALYFGEDNGLGRAYIEVVYKVMACEPHVCLARPLALLRADLRPIISEYMKQPKGSIKRRLAAALQANYHLSSVVDVDTTAWQSIGVKAVANRVLTCKSANVEKNIKKSLEWRRTLKLALLLAERREKPSDIYKIVGTKRPGAALRSALSYFERNKSGNVEIDVWRAVAPALDAIDLSVEQRRYLRRSLDEADFMPSEIQAEYWAAIFGAFQRISKQKAMPVLCRLENLLSEVNKDVVKKVIDGLLEEFHVKIFSDDDHYLRKCNRMKVRIVAKYLLLSEGDEQNDRLDNIWVPFCDRLVSLVTQNTKYAARYLDEFVNSLKYHKAFFNPRLSSLSILERIVADLRKLLPMEGYFQTFVLLHATMLYYKSIEYCLKQYPEKFEDVRRKRLEGVAVVGNLFGNYVGKELIELVSKYFKSITMLYMKNLMIFIRDEIEFSENRNKFVTAFIKGLLEAANTEALLVAQYVLDKEGGYKTDPERMELLNILKSSQNDEVTFFLHAYL